MPKKTKKEKIIALYRKKLKLLHEKQVNVSINKITKIEEEDFHPGIEKNAKPKVISEQHQNKQEKNTDFFLQDLKKSLILTGVVIALEIFLYFIRIIR